jgi:large subunit ribosomal protein L13Ae
MSLPGMFSRYVSLPWTQKLTCHRLEERRKAKGAAYYERKKIAARQLADAKKNATVKEETSKALANFGY